MTGLSRGERLDGERQPVSGGMVCLDAPYDLIAGAGFGVGTENTASKSTVSVPGRRDDGAYVGRTGAGEWLLSALAGVVSTFHVRTIVFGILMTHASRYRGFVGRALSVCAAVASAARLSKLRDTVLTGCA